MRDRRAGLLALAGLAAGCTGPAPAQTDPCAAISWEGTAEPLLTTWCTPCHASTVVGEDRRGAPEGLDFDGWARASASAALIASAVAPGAARMPPVGGMPDPERTALVAWAECGAPGPDTPTVPDRCAERVPFEGDAAGDGAVCAAGANAVTGTLTVAGPPTGAVDCICEVDGDVVVSGEGGAVELPNLWRIGGALRVEGATLDRLAFPALTEAGTVGLTDVRVGELDLDRLTTVRASFFALRGSLPPTLAPQRLQRVGESVGLSGVDGIVRIELPRLEEVGGDLVVDGLPALGQVVHTSDLITVGGSLRLVGNPALLEVEDFGFLTTVGGDVEIGGGGALQRIDGLFDLQRVAGQLLIRNEPSLVAVTGLTDLRFVGGPVVVRATGAVAIDALGDLQQIGGLEVTDNPGLSVWQWQVPSEVRGEVRIAANPALVALPLAGLTSVDGGFALVGNAALADPGAEDLATVGGSLTLEENTVLAGLDGLRGLQSVGGDVVIRSNPALPQADIDLLLQQIDVGGTVTVEGNGARSEGDLAER